MYFAHFFVIFALFYLCNMDYFLIQFFEKPLPPQRKRPKYTRDGCYMSNRNWREKSMWSIKVLHCDLCVQLGHESLIHLRTRAWSRAQKQPWPAGWPMTPALQSGMTSTLLPMSKYLLSLSLSLSLPYLTPHLWSTLVPSLPVLCVYYIQSHKTWFNCHLLGCCYSFDQGKWMNM